MKYTIIFILVLYTFISCNTKEKLSNNDLIKENLKGDVVLVETQETSKDYTDYFTATFFNNLGMKELFFISSKTSLSKLLRKDEIKYVNNKIVESINKLYTIDGDNKIYSDNYSIKFKYDKDGRF
jgi:predicted peroxiredoxin